jgi:hypothetical protein
MRGGSIDGEPLFDDMVCATCFTIIAKDAGVASMWRLTADEVHVELEVVTPSGRIWDEKARLWVAPGNEGMGVGAHQRVQASKPMRETGASGPPEAEEAPLKAHLQRAQGER